MENTVDRSEARRAGFKAALSTLAGLAASALGLSSAFAWGPTNSTGVVLDTNAVTGMKAGIGDAVTTIQTSLNNAYLTEIAIMFIGFAVIVGVVMYVVKGHRRI